jgi:uncharacterized membrane protein
MNPENKPRTENMERLTNVGFQERLMSLVGGAALTYLGLRKKNQPLGIGVAAVGSSLLLRGASGFCPLNQALNRDSAHLASTASGKK